MPTATHTYADLIELRRGLNIIDAPRLCTVEGKTTTRDWILSGAVRTRLASLEIMLAPHFKAFDKENERLRREFCTVPKTDKDGNDYLAAPLDKQNDYQDAVEKLLDAEVAITLPTFTDDELAIGDNPKDGKNPFPVACLRDIRLIRGVVAPAATPPIDQSEG